MLALTFLMPLPNNSKLFVEVSKEEISNIENKFKQDDINIWLDILKNADDLREKGLINEAEELYNIACNMLHKKKYATNIIQAIGNH